MGEECYICAIAALAAGPLLLQVTRHLTFIVVVCAFWQRRAHTRTRPAAAETVEKVKQLRVWSRVGRPLATFHKHKLLHQTGSVLQPQYTRMRVAC